MTTATEEKKVTIWTKEEKDNLKSKYGSEILVENGSYEDVTITPVSYTHLRAHET